jgi:putative transposase
MIREYVRNQPQKDIAANQIGMKEFTDPFTGKPVRKGK